MKNKENIIPGTINQIKPDVPGYTIYNSAVKNNGDPATGPNNWAYDEFEKNEDKVKTTETDSKETTYDALIDEVKFNNTNNIPATNPERNQKLPEGYSNSMTDTHGDEAITDNDWFYDESDNSDTAEK